MEDLRKISPVELKCLSLHEFLTLASAINLGLNELTDKNFRTVAENLACYGYHLYCLYKNTPSDELEKAIFLLESHLKRINVLTSVNSLERLNTYYNHFKVQIMQVGNHIGINIKTGSFSDYYQYYRINQDLADSSLDCLALVEWLLRYGVRFIAPHHYPRVIRDSAFNLEECRHLCEFLNQQARSVINVNLAMECAFKAGHVQLIIDLIKSCMACLPDDISQYEVILPCLIAAKGNPETDQLLLQIEKKFSSDVLFAYGITHFDYHIAAHFLSKITMTPDIRAFSHILSIAASCGDIAFINQVLKKFPDDHSQFVSEVVLPFYQPLLPQNLDSSRGVSYDGTDQEKYQSEFNRMVSILQYYIKQGRFTYSFSEESEESQLLGPVRCGYLRKIIAFSSSKSKNNYQVGAVRNCLTHTSPNAGIKPDYYFEHCKLFFTALAKYDSTDLNNLISPELISYSCQVNFDHSPQIVQLTRYVGTKKLGVCEWIHTDPKYFLRISRHCQQLYQQSCDEQRSFSLQIPDFFKCLFRIQFYLSHGSYYTQDSVNVCEIIAHAMFKSQGLLHPTVTPYQSNCLALSTIDENFYIDRVPEIFGFTSFPQLFKSLSDAYIAYQQQDRIAYDVITNQILKLSDLIKQFRSPQDIISPNEHTLLRRIAGFRSVTELKQILLFVSDIDHVDEGSFQRTALHWAIIESRLENSKVLINAGARSDILDAKENKTAAEYAAESTNPEIRSLFGLCLDHK